MKDESTVKSFSKVLSELNFENKILYNDELCKKLGTKFYKIAIYTKGGILLNPAKLVRAMKSGNRMVVYGTSSRGTKTTDTYSLSGFTAMKKRIDKACK